MCGITGYVGEQAGAVDLEFDDEYLRELAEIQFVAAGTSYHASLYAAHLIETLVDLPASATIASEYDFDAGRDHQRTPRGSSTPRSTSPSSAS